MIRALVLLLVATAATAATAGELQDSRGMSKLTYRKKGAPQNNPIPFSSLKVGDKLEVEGTSRGDGGVLAKKLKLQD